MGVSLTTYKSWDDPQKAGHKQLKPVIFPTKFQGSSHPQRQLHLLEMIGGWLRYFPHPPKNYTCTSWIKILPPSYHPSFGAIGFWSLLCDRICVLNVAVNNTLPTLTLHLKIGLPKRKGMSSDYQFSGAMLVSGRVYNISGSCKECTICAALHPEGM